MSEIMKTSWAFSIGADESNDDGGDPHLDSRIRFPPIAGYDGGPEIECGFHLLAIPLFSLAHSEETYADLVMKMIDALCPDWRMKLIESSTDGAGNMTGFNAGFSSVLRNESLCADSFYRIWCLAHQLYLVVKAAVNRLDESEVFIFWKVLTEVIAYLRRQKKLIFEMGSRCPYYITVRWSSLANVCKWLLANQTRVSAYIQENMFAHSPSPAW
jgi:hypothetical protein